MLQEFLFIKTEMYINSITDIFHGLTIERKIQQLVEIFFKIVCCFCRILDHCRCRRLTN